MYLKFKTPFQGTLPRKSARSLSAGQAQTALNVNLFDGGIDSFKNDVDTAWTFQKTGLIKTIYRFAADSGSPKFLMWLTDVDVVRGQVSGNIMEKTYYTGDGVPRKLDATRVAANGVETPLNLDVPAPTVALTGVATPNANDGLNEYTNYVHTFVTAWGEESPPSPPSAQVKFDTASVSVVLTGIGTPPAGAYDIQNIRIYRDVSGQNGTQYQFVTEQPLATVTYTDTADSSAIASTGALVTAIYDIPPAGINGLKSFPNGVMVAFDGSDLLFSEPYQPYTFPIEYRQSVDYPIVGLGVYGNTVLVCTTNHPYIFTGIHPSGMTGGKLPERQSCVSKRSIVDMGSASVYASPDGLVMVNGGNAILATDKFISRVQWQALNPSSIHAYYSEGRYIGFYDATPLGGSQGGFIVSLRDPDFGFVWLDTYYTAGFTDDVNDELFLVTPPGPWNQPPTTIVKWNSGALKTHVWKSGIEVLPRPINFSCAKIVCGRYPETIKFFADNVLKHTQIVTSREPFRLPAGFLANEWEIEVSGTGNVSSIEIAESMQELKQL